MKIEELIDIYTSWKDFEDEPTDELQQILDDFSKNQSDESDAFFWKIIHDFDNDKDGFWLDSAIRYMHYCKDKDFAQSSLEEIVGDYEKFGGLGTGINSAANFLGEIASYPNDVLKSAISSSIDTSDPSEILAHRLFRASAYGAYIMTATDFETGLEAGRAIKDSEEMLTILRAEEFIRKWRAKHGKS